MPAESFKLPKAFARDLYPAIISPHTQNAYALYIRTWRPPVSVSPRIKYYSVGIPPSFGPEVMAGMSDVVYVTAARYRNEKKTAGREPKNNEKTNRRRRRSGRGRRRRRRSFVLFFRFFSTNLLPHNIAPIIIIPTGSPPTTGVA